MNRNELIEHVYIHAQGGVSWQTIEECIRLTLNAIQETTLAGEDVKLRGFGTFYLKKFHKTNSRHPQTNAVIKTIPKQKIAFRPSKKNSVQSQ